MVINAWRRVAYGKSAHGADFKRGYMEGSRRADGEFSRYVDGFKSALSAVDQRARALTEESLSHGLAAERVGEINSELAELIDQKIELQTALSRAEKGSADVTLDDAQLELADYAAPDKTHHQQRMDMFTLWIAALLVGALFLITFLGVFRNMTGEAVAQAAAPIAGLAGIAVGYLFSDRRSRSGD